MSTVAGLEFPFQSCVCVRSRARACVYNKLSNLRVHEKKKLAALSMLHKAKKAYYACDVIRFRVPYAARLKLLVFFASPLPLPSMNRVAARTGCVVHAPCLLAVRQLP